MKIAVIGTGYVGLVTGTCFAETGNEVTCVDIDQRKVDKLSAGEITIYEPGLEKIFLRNLKEQRLHFTSDLKAGIKDAKILFLALPTPPGEDGLPKSWEISLKTMWSWWTKVLFPSEQQRKYKRPLLKTARWNLMLFPILSSCGKGLR